MARPQPGVDPPRHAFLGIWVNALDISALNALVREAISHDSRCLIAHHNLHSLRLVQDDPALREFFQRADYVHIDGMPLVGLGRMFGHPLDRSHRVTYVDWLPPLMRLASEQAWRVFYLGGKPGIADAGAQLFREQNPGIEIATRHGYFDASRDSTDTLEVIAQINRFDPHVLMVGMGMPRQEHWIGDNRQQIRAPVILPAGASFDYFAGAIPTPPRWSGQVGLEWLFRLISEPRRLGHRYLVEPWFIAPLVARELMGRLATRGAKPGGGVSSGPPDDDGP